MDNSQQSPAILSLCPGMLGIERGLERAFVRLGWTSPKTIAYVEIEAFIIFNLVKQMEKGVLDPVPIWSNLKTFPWEILRTKVDIFTGGYPCQPFSVAGNLGAENDPRHLFPHIAKGIDIIRPGACFFENVSNHLNIGYEAVRTKLQDLGYHVEEGIYSAEEVGAPHRRERMFILAILGNSNVCKSDSGSRNTGEMFGISKEKCESKFSSAISRRTGTEMGNTQISGLQEQRNGTIGDKSSQSMSTGSSNELAHSDNSRSREDSKSSELWTNSIKQSSRHCRSSNQGPNYQGRFDRWPARPGQDQFEWECARTQSRMGFTINGYNYREDLLRMAGNGVVEQTAEIAFIDLLQKHKR